MVAFVCRSLSVVAASHNIRQRHDAHEQSGLLALFRLNLSHCATVRLDESFDPRWRTKATVTRVQRVSALKALCVGRHRYLSEHFGQFFRKLGVDAICVVGVADAVGAAREQQPDIVFCEYDLLATVPLEPWERDPFLSRVPVIAVSLTRRSDEMHLLDINNIAGFFYLPALTDDDARRLLHAVRPSAGYSLQSSLERTHQTSAPSA